MNAVDIRARPPTVGAMPSSGGKDRIPWQVVCDQAASAMTVLDLEGRFLYVNRALCRLLGYERDEIVQHHRHDFVHPDDRPGLDMIGDVLAEPSGEVSREFRCVRSDGRVIWLLLSASVIRDDEDRPLYIVTHAQDVTARHEFTIRWQRTFAHAPIGMALLDTRGVWTEVNAALCELLGYSHDELVDLRPADLTYPDEEASPVLSDVFAGRIDRASLETRYRHKAGHPVWLLVRVSAVPGPEGEPLYVVGQYEEIGDRRMSDEHLAHLALHDPLTGLANRALLADRLDHAIAELARDGGALAVMLVDLDKLKETNDRHGHAVGDQLLISVADALLHVARTSDTVARFGGDEFVVVSRVTDLAASEALRDRVEGCLRADVVLSGRRVSLQASVGLAATTSSTISGVELLDAADRDMYIRKARSRR
ncbi:PAS domain S-box protein [Saccharopolyspora griseoalba]|uniref:PAS domain S-box protein n=1 Tax=Saccharopolyspora griseoalba TaxID=1431848 RepID=A0ABW2LSA4_9PSEU